MIYVIYYFYKMFLKEEINIYELFKLVILFHLLVLSLLLIVFYSNII